MQEVHPCIDYGFIHMTRMQLLLLNVHLFVCEIVQFLQQLACKGWSEYFCAFEISIFKGDTGLWDQKITKKPIY